MKNGASDRLFHARSLSPEEVFDLVEAEVHEELDPYLDDPSDDPAMQDIYVRERDEILDAAKEARELYQAHGVDAFPLMAGSSNDWTQAIGEALVSGEYKKLAI